VARRDVTELTKVSALAGRNIKPEDIEQLVAALAELRVEVDDESGEKVRVFCE